MIKFILFSFLWSFFSYGVQTVFINKSAGFDTALQLMRIKTESDYPGKTVSDSVNLQPAPPFPERLYIHLPDSESDTLAIAILAAVEMPVCTTSASMTIRIQFGTYLVDDDTVVTNDPVDEKFFNPVITISGGTFQVEVLEKTTGAYDNPSGSFPVSLCEFSVPGAGSSLTKIQDFIR